MSRMRWDHFSDASDLRVRGWVRGRRDSLGPSARPLSFCLASW